MGGEIFEQPVTKCPLVDNKDSVDYKLQGRHKCLIVDGEID